MNTNLIIVVALMAVKCLVVNAGFCAMTAATYNTALLDRSIDTENVIPNNRVERREQMIQMLSNSAADVICLQEVWLAEDAKAIIDGVVSTFPYSFSKIHKRNTINKPSYGSNRGPSCNFLKLFTLTDCVSSSCTSSSTLEDYWTCMHTTCMAQTSDFLSTATENCITCVTSALPNVTGVLEMCSGAGIDEGFRRVNSPGLLLLSRDPIKNRQYRPFFPQIDVIVRSKLVVKIRGINVVCTHLSENIVPFYPEVYVGPAYSLTSFAEQNQYEATDLASDYATPGANVLVLGDFSNGLSTNGMNATNTGGYGALASMFINRPISVCTICSRDENPYNDDNAQYITSAFYGKGIRIRHIKRVFTTDDGSIEYNGQTLPLSDSFGVEAIITNTK